MARRLLIQSEMKIGNVLSRDVVACSALDSLEHVVRLMAERDLGSVVVIDRRDRVLGLVTERDVCLAAFRQEQRLREIPVTAAITSEPVWCRDSDDALDVERVMREHRIRRVLVANERGLLVGIASLADLARAARAGQLPADDVAATLAAVARP